jgi:hypothetical protein
MSGRVPDEILGVATIKDRCSRKDCDQEVIAVAAFITRDVLGVKLVWLCDEHATGRVELPADQDELDATNASVQDLERTCAARPHGPSAPRCGAYATHVLLLGLTDRGRPEIRVASVCEKHAAARLPKQDDG